MLRTKLENDYNDNNSNSLNRFEPPSQTLTSPLRLLFPNPLFSIRISRDCEFSSRENFIGAKRLIKDAHLFENLLEALDKAGESINWGTLGRVYHPRGGWPGHLLFTYNSWRGVTRPDRPQLTRDQLFFDGHGLFPNTWPRSTR